MSIALSHYNQVSRLIREHGTLRNVRLLIEDDYGYAVAIQTCKLSDVVNKAEEFADKGWHIDKIELAR